MPQKVKPKRSTTLHKRVKLTPDQYDRVAKEYGKGVVGLYDPLTYTQQLKRIRGLSKMRAKCKKFALFTDQLGRRLYIGDRELMGIKKGDPTTPITFDKKEALQFYEGFDNSELKITHYNAALGMLFKGFLLRAVYV